MEKMKISKNVTIDDDNYFVVKALMSQTKKNFSQTLDLIIVQWVRLSNEAKERRSIEENERLQAELKKNLEIHKKEAAEKLKQMKKAKVIKE